MPSKFDETALRRISSERDLNIVKKKYMQFMPIDIVAKMLHQKDLNVTGYYSAPTPTQIVESVSELHDVISSYVDIDDVYLRSPQELQKEFDVHAEKVGVFNKVLGGTCVTDYVCPTKMQCLGCKAKIPEPLTCCNIVISI